MPKLIRDKSTNTYHHHRFDKVAEQRFTKILATGETIPWDEMRDYLERRIAGESVTPPKPKKLAG